MEGGAQKSPQCDGLSWGHGLCLSFPPSFLGGSNELVPVLHLEQHLARQVLHECLLGGLVLSSFNPGLESREDARLQGCCGCAHVDCSGPHAARLGLPGGRLSRLCWRPKRGSAALILLTPFPDIISGVGTLTGTGRADPWELTKGSCWIPGSVGSSLTSCQPTCWGCHSALPPCFPLPPNFLPPEASGGHGFCCCSPVTVSRS